MSGINCTVSINSDSFGSFLTGSIINGTLKLECKVDQKIEKIDFEVIGISKAHWTRPMPTIPYIKNYSEKKKILNIKMFNILNDAIVDKKLRAGIIYTHPFHFALPEDLPSTFESSIAKVFYYIKIKSKPNKKIRKIIPFTVCANVNLNQTLEMINPYVQEFHKAFRISGNFSITVKTFKGFAPKQIVPFDITINNQKQVAIQKINVMLFQKVKYDIQAGYAEEEKKVCKVSHKHFLNTAAETCFLEMQIPDVVPSSIHLTDTMIHITYVLRIKVTFHFHFSLQEDLPVTIGTVPVAHHIF